jgi:hypothetical protein
MNDFIKHLGANIERINDKALEYAMLDICDHWVDSDSDLWEEHADDILELQSEFFDDDLNECLQECMDDYNMSAEQIVSCLKQHHQRMADIIGESYIDAWYENFIENYGEETAE